MIENSTEVLIDELPDINPIQQDLAEDIWTKSSSADLDLSNEEDLSIVEDTWWEIDKDGKPIKKVGRGGTIKQHHVDRVAIIAEKLATMTEKINHHSLQSKSSNAACHDQAHNVFQPHQFVPNAKAISACANAIPNYPPVPDEKKSLLSEFLAFSKDEFVASKLKVASSVSTTHLNAEQIEIIR